MCLNAEGLGGSDGSLDMEAGAARLGFGAWHSGTRGSTGDMFSGFRSGLIESRCELLRGGGNDVAEMRSSCSRRGDLLQPPTTSPARSVTLPRRLVLFALFPGRRSHFHLNHTRTFNQGLLTASSAARTGLRARWWSIHSTSSTVMVCGYALLCLTVAKFASGLHILETLAQRSICGSQRRCGDGRRQNSSIQGG
jgi:hypothetical protein